MRGSRSIGSEKRSSAPRIQMQTTADRVHIGLQSKPRHPHIMRFTNWPQPFVPTTNSRPSTHHPSHKKTFKQSHQHPLPEPSHTHPKHGGRVGSCALRGRDDDDEAVVPEVFRARVLPHVEFGPRVRLQGNTHKKRNIEDRRQALSKSACQETHTNKKQKA